MNTITGGIRKVGMTAAEQFWYVLGCVAFGAAYLQKVPVKKALSEYGLTEMTSAEQFWYTLGCVFFGMAYLAKVPAAKALSELDQFRVARAAPHDVLQPHEIHQALPEIHEVQPGQREIHTPGR